MAHSKNFSKLAYNKFCTSDDYIKYDMIRQRSIITGRLVPIETTQVVYIRVYNENKRA